MRSSHRSIKRKKERKKESLLSMKRAASDVSGIEDVSASTSSEVRSEKPPEKDDLRLVSDGKYLVLFNISKMNNVRNLCVTARSFGYGTIMVGQAHGTLEEKELKWGPSMDDDDVQRTSSMSNLVRQFAAAGMPLYGIEIMDNAKSILDPALMGSVPAGHALMPGNEGSGLNVTQKRACSSFIYIPHYGHGTASLNVNVATGICMHTIAFPVPVPVPVPVSLPLS
jgi:tRNA G18 (ribose-2'-O)-methylase SpoU